MATTKRTPANGAGQLGARLIAALVPRHFPTLSALQLAAQGPAYSTLSNWKHGKAIPEWVTGMPLENRAVANNRQRSSADT